MPDNLMPILGDTIGWELLNVQNKNTSIEDYAETQLVMKLVYKLLLILHGKRF